MSKDTDGAPGLESESAVDRVIVFIKAAIREGRFVPGQRLVEPDLTTELGVGRGSVREGLRRLAAEGFIEMQRFRGARVRRMTREDVKELNEIRAVLEGYAAATAAARIDEEGRAALLALEQGLDRAGISDPLAYGRYNERFHALIYDLGQHRHLQLFIEQTQLAVFRLQFDLVLLTPRRMAESREEHRAIVAAILKGNPREAEDAMRRHISGTTAVILDSVRD
jgi:DNA-binding GntR family transcriptional regulator